MGAIQVCHLTVPRLHAKTDLHGVAQMLLIKGTMSAISAGMLIYAATVEMIAGDFVFGDVDGGHGHGHGHGHLDPHPRSSSSRHNGDGDEPHTPDDDGKHLQEQLKLKATTTKKALAVLSLFAGVAGMVIIG
jgi:zinc transporter 1/2/3